MNLAEVQTVVEQLASRVLIDGQLVRTSKGTSYSVRNPATGLEIAQVAQADASDVDVAVKSAVHAQASWACLAVRERAKLLLQAAGEVARFDQELATIMCLETGKALRTECRPEAANVADMLSFFAGLAPEIKGETVPVSPGVLAYTKREPVGVVAAVLPWNVPLLLFAVKVAPALVAGNSIVVKPAQEAPLAVLRAAQLMNRFLPAGVLNVITGDGPVCGAALVAHPAVDKVTFTGSVQTGRKIYHAAAEKLVPVTLELGGKSPMIVLADADLGKVVEGALIAMRFTRQGQSCTAASRIFIHRSHHDAFVSALEARLNKLKMGDPLSEGTDIGTIISRAQFDKVNSYIEMGRATPGAKAYECCSLPDDPALKAGTFVRPVIFTGLSNDSRLAREEIFGPVVCVIPFDTEEEAIGLANDTEFGLAASVWTDNLGKALRLVDALDAGFVQVNQARVAGPNISYGGFKHSGLGKELTLESMLEHFTRSKTVLVNYE